MEMATALTVTGDAVLFYDVALQVVKLVREVCQSNDEMHKEEEELQKRMQRLQSLRDRMGNEHNLEPRVDLIRKQCQAMYNEITPIVDKVTIKLSDGSKGRSTLRRSWAGSKARRELDAIEKTLKCNKSALKDDVLPDAEFLCRLMLDMGLGETEPSHAVLSQLHDSLTQDNRDNSKLKETLLSMAGMQLGELRAPRAVEEGIEAATTRQRFLDSIAFPKMNVRQQQLGDGHPETLTWLFDNEARPPREQSKNVEAWRCRQQHKLWMRQANAEMFWIHGKPGSGKSTLLARLATNRIRLAALLNKKWCPTNDLLVASYFTWKMGAELQHSADGADDTEQPDDMKMDVL